MSTPLCLQQSMTRLLKCALKKLKTLAVRCGRAPSRMNNDVFPRFFKAFCIATDSCWITQIERCGNRSSSKKNPMSPLKEIAAKTMTFRDAGKMAWKHVDFTFTKMRQVYLLTKLSRKEYGESNVSYIDFGSIQLLRQQHGEHLA